tara:strand:- start:20128 stop:20739 length:612 start_codon:yes stop_codon:yes gene_type:complete
MTTTEILPLFSQPVLVVNHDSPPNTELLEFCKTLDYTLNGGGKNFSSNNTSILDLKEFSHIKEKILVGLHEYAHNIMGWTSLEFYITQSWLNANPPGTKHHRHYHFNSIISGTYYLETSDEDNIVFYSDHKPQLDFANAHYNIYNASVYKVPIKTNSLVLFPSTLTHSVDENTAEWERVSIAFNIFVRGTLGSREHLTLLELK